MILILLFLFWQQNKSWKPVKAHLDLLKHHDPQMHSFLKLYQYLPHGLRTYGQKAVGDV